MPFLDEGVVGLVILALMAYCVFDVIRTEASAVQNLPKMIWLMLVILLGPIGSIAWLLLGRPSRASFDLRSSGYRAPAQPIAPTGLAEPRLSEADHQRARDEALRRYEAERELRKREEELQRREEALRRKEDEAGGAL